MYPSTFIINKEETQECITKRLVYLSKKKMHTNTDRDKISATTLENSKIPSDFLVKYDIVEDYKPFLINSFRTVGWSDPFPDEGETIIGSRLEEFLNLFVHEDAQDLVYEPSRYCKEHSPLHLYVPKKEVMLKIMRACIGVNKITDFWFVNHRRSLT